MLSTPVLYHGARVVRVFQLPRLDSQPAFLDSQEVQTPPAPAADPGPPVSTSLAASFLNLIQEHFQCPMVAHSLMGQMLGRPTQNFVVSLMEGIAREFRDTPPENPELRSYACGALRDDWQRRNRVGRLLIHDIQQLRGPLTPTEASRMVLLARLRLQGEGVGSAQLPILSTEDPIEVGRLGKQRLVAVDKIRADEGGISPERTMISAPAVVLKHHWASLIVGGTWNTRLVFPKSSER
ncbi:uncharacterized protein EDB93DRAFT_1109693 [Suillus bovinus]|uniref:uncharacterized protein n=1 Tax=Suillus bovinus TaxID=48563 RepID=UPI001B85C1A4|nr:uncharacterized protein EDB93DRAFT_1109693 [Suillus bovinus]KAG2126341.1 hypothetical protein EDB93DRAFT_1109693 [Suillus bovinus]